jgi:hypothetical protein
MKRIWMITAILSVLILSVVFAEDKAGTKTTEKASMQMSEKKDSGMACCQGMMDKGMMGQGMMKKGMMSQGMMGSMLEKKLVATQDGGVVVWVGNKLIKYDKDLKLVKEVELKVDMPKMQQKMKENMPDMEGTGETEQ